MYTYFGDESDELDMLAVFLLICEGKIISNMLLVAER